MRASKVHGLTATLAILAGGCDVLLGLEHRELSQPDGGSGASTTSSSSSSSGTGGSSASSSTSSGSGGSNVCSSGQTQCAGNMPQACDANGAWQDQAACPAQAPTCAAGVCGVPPSCSGLPSTCGPSGNESCCTSPTLPKGTYNRTNDPAFPATLSDFRIDRFEITVGRFRKFVESYPGNLPAAGAGAHPLIPGSGWQTIWNTGLTADQAALKMALKCEAVSQTWTDDVGANEDLPMNCVNWYEAFAFCSWDKGRLPTEAEWNYAAAGGDEQRQYPWSSPPGSTTVDSSYAVYNHVPLTAVGSKSGKGDGKWTQADLGGGVWEWNLDWFSDPFISATCNDCAFVSNGGSASRVIRGSSWTNDATFMLNSARTDYDPTFHVSSTGARCARTP